MNHLTATKSIATRQTATCGASVPVAGTVQHCTRPVIHDGPHANELGTWQTTEAMLAASCWSCGAPADGLCADCADIDGDAIPDMDDPSWKGNTKPREAIFVAPPNAKRVR